MVCLCVCLFGWFCCVVVCVVSFVWLLGWLFVCLFVCLFRLFHLFICVSFKFGYLFVSVVWFFVCVFVCHVCLIVCFGWLLVRLSPVVCLPVCLFVRLLVCLFARFWRHIALGLHRRLLWLLFICVFVFRVSC